MSPLASAILRRLQPRITGAKPLVGERLYGSYHALLLSTFDDTGLCWIVKFSINDTACQWNELSASALNSEANTMRLLKRGTTIPLPDVMDFSSTMQNTLRCSQIIMAFNSGIPLYNVWFGQETSPKITRLRRIRALKSIASMTQMDRFSFRTGGTLLFGDDGSLSGIGSMRRVDYKTMLDRCFIHEDPDDDPIYLEYPAFSDPKAY